MKRIVPLILAVFFSIPLFASSVFATEVTPPVTEAVTEAAPQALEEDDFDIHFARLNVSSSLGDLSFIFPEGISSSTLVLDGQFLRNMSNSTVYLYCPQFPDYTFSASRFGTVGYRPNNGSYQTVELIVQSVEDPVPSFEDVFPWIFLALIVISMFAHLWEFSKR